MTWASSTGNSCQLPGTAALKRDSRESASQLLICAMTSSRMD